MVEEIHCKVTSIRCIALERLCTLFELDASLNDKCAGVLLW